MPGLVLPFSRPASNFMSIRRGRVDASSSILPRYTPSLPVLVKRSPSIAMRAFANMAAGISCPRCRPAFFVIIPIGIIGFGGLMANELNRRNCLKAAAIAAGPAVIAARGANEKINVGWIGVGTRGDYGIRWLHDAAPDEVQLTAICDTCQFYIDRGIANVKKTWGNTPATYKD